MHYSFRRGGIIAFALMTAGCAAITGKDIPVPEPAVTEAPAVQTQLAEPTPAPPVTPEIGPETQTVAAGKVVIPEPEPAPPADVWSRMRAGFQLDHEVDRRRVLNELKWFVKHPEYVDRVAKRADPYLYYIIGELEKRNMPLEFALLPIVESAYDPFAYSHGRASGLWQFIPSTARLYGLKIDWWYDGRRDVEASTRAALDYLVYLHDMFDDDWLLALAAYNAGQGNVMRNIRAARKKGHGEDFWSLDVLKETYTYVPRLLAVSELFNNPQTYHIELPHVANEAKFVGVETGGQLDLEKAAVLAGLTSGQLYKLNPGFNQWATHPDGPHRLLVPIENEAQFREALKDLPANDRVAWTRHKIRPGETLGLIAKRYHTTVSVIKTANNIKGNVIRAGDYVLIPSADRNTTYEMTAEGRLAQRQQYLKDNVDPNPIKYKVQPGDTLWDISRQYNVGMRELARWNGMGTTGLLHPGEELLVFKKGGAKPKQVAATKPPRNEQVRKLNYRVRSGESLSVIANKFNVTVQKIKQWNQALAQQKYIHPGDRLTLYVDVTRLIN